MCKKGKLTMQNFSSGVIIYGDKKMKTKEGYDLEFGTNHLGHFLLTNLLLPLVRNSARNGFNARIVIVSSLGHAHGKIHFEDINLESTPYKPFKAYNQSKLANVMHSIALARRLKDSGITVYCVHPGVINTDISRDIEATIPYLSSIVFPFFSYVAKTPFYGAQTTLYCLLDDKISSQTGMYYSDCQEKRPHPSAMAENDQEKLWVLSEAMVSTI